MIETVWVAPRADPYRSLHKDARVASLLVKKIVSDSIREEC